MGYRSGKLNVPHALSADTGLGNLHAASVTDHAFITNLFVFSTVTLPVFTGSEDTLTEQSVSYTHLDVYKRQVPSAPAAPEAVPIVLLMFPVPAFFFLSPAPTKAGKAVTGLYSFLQGHL